MRGERVEVGDFIEYVYARNITVKEEQKRFQNFHKRKEIDFLNRKGGDIAESVNFVIQVLLFNFERGFLFFFARRTTN